MRIQHNIAALSSYRNLTNNNNAVSKSLEKLSSGYRINRAGDDAAGLAISEKMRAQITGLQTAQKNANDGISLVQTAEGALTEVHSMLNRMVELANQSANGTYADDVDRENLQAEVDALIDEIDRISDATNFNGINLLDGSLGLNGKTFKIGGEQAAVEATLLDGTSTELGVTVKHHGSSTTEVEPAFTVDLADYAVKKTAAGDVTFTLQIGGQTVNIADSNTALNTASTTVKVTTTAANEKKDASAVAAAFNNKFASIGNDVYKMTTNGTKISFEYQGQKKADGSLLAKTTDEGKVQTSTWTPSGDVKITATGADGELNRDNCHLTNVTDPVVGTDPVRAGATLKITQDIINAGKLKIGETEFTFDNTKTAADATGNVIGTKGLTGAELLKSVTSQLSKKTTTIKDADGTAHNFTIGRGNATDTIEIEEDVLTNQKYGQFTEEELKKAFSQSRGQANASNSVQLLGVPKAGDSINIGGVKYTFGDGNDQVKIGATAADSAKNLADKIGSSATVSGDTVTVSAATATDPAPKIGSAGLSLQIGDTSDEFNRLTVEVGNMSSKALGIDAIDISSQGGAQAAVDKIKNAINAVSSQRGKLGAVQNRLEHTINNLSVTTENITAAESRIRDVDMAQEMMAYTKNNILVQSAQAMLAQANQIPQGVLQLLQ